MPLRPSVLPSGIPIAALDGVTNTENEPQPSNGRARKGPRLGLMLSLMLIAIVAAGVWFWRSQTAGTGRTEGLSAVQSTLHLETFVLNLADADQSAYLRVGIDLRLDQDVKHAQEAVPTAEIRDTILATLGEAKGEELTTSDGKGKLKQNVLHALQERVPDLGVKEIYFTEFLIQR